MTRQPYVDESWYASPAWNLAENGSMGTPVLEPVGSPMPGMNVSLHGIRTHTYWVMPVPIVAQAAWYKLFGFGLFTLRAFSVMWGILLLVVWFVFIRALSQDKMVAFLSVALTAMDSVFVSTASLGRMDMMSAALGFSGLAAYLCLRGRSLARAVCISNSLVVASGLSHPNGGILTLLLLGFLTFDLDRHRLKWQHAVLAGFPYVVGGLVWGAYILQDPTAFGEQFFNNTTGRFQALGAPSFWRELRRYLDAYGFNPEATGLSRMKVIVLLVYGAAVGMTCFVGEVRRQQGCRSLLTLTGIVFLGLTLLENYKVQWYLIYIIPLLASLTAVCLLRVSRETPDSLILAGLAGLIAAQLTGTCRAIARNDYRNAYLPAVRFVQALGAPTVLVMGSSEFGFGVGFRQNLIDDVRLGYLTGKCPDVIVVGERYRESFEHFRRSEPGTFEHVTHYLNHEFRPVLQTATHTVYIRKKGGGLCK